MSKYDRWIEYHLNKKARARTKDRAEGLRAFLAYKRGEPAQAEEKKDPQVKPKRSKANQPEDWSFLDE